MNKEYPKKIADNVTMYAADPILYVVDDFLSNDECDAFIEASKGSFNPQQLLALINIYNMKVEPVKIAG
jgi:valyl-tRNA synthetase